jgi:hypothetical protein
MKSVIVANDFLTTLANNDVSKLTRGQAVLLNSAGKVVAAASDVKDDEMLQFVLGLGDEVKNLYYHLIDLSKIALTGDEFNGQIIVNGNEIDISDILSLYDSDSDKVDLYEIAGLTCDRLRQALSNEYNVYWENLIGRYYKDCIIITSNAKDEITLKVNNNHLKK